MNQRLNLLLALAFFLASVLLAQSSEPPRTEHGYPDLQGTYTFRTITPQRPAEREKDTLTAEEAAEWAAYENRRQNRDLVIDSVGERAIHPVLFRTMNFGMNAVMILFRIVVLLWFMTRLTADCRR